jgi:hypothetical protein
VVLAVLVLVVVVVVVRRGDWVVLNISLDPINKDEEDDDEDDGAAGSGSGAGSVDDGTRGEPPKAKGGSDSKGLVGNEGCG